MNAVLQSSSGDACDTGGGWFQRRVLGRAPWRSLLAGACVIWTLSACDVAERSVALQHESNDEIAVEWKAVCEEFRSSNEPYYGTQQLVELESMLARQDIAPEGRAILQARLGAEQLRLGQNQAATEQFEHALAQARASKLDESIQQDILRRTALAHLRSAETSNCVAMHGAGSCIYPISESAVHAQRESTTRAFELYGSLASAPNSPPVLRFLHLIAGMSLGVVPQEVRAQLRSVQQADYPRWQERAATRGFQNSKPSGGLVVDDFDQDGDFDLITSTIDPCGSMEFFENDGTGQFSNQTIRWNLQHHLGGLNIIHADYDSDGDYDLFVLRGGWMDTHGTLRNSLLRNDGEQGFVDVTRAAGLDQPAQPTQTAAWADFDLDGDLDLYIGNESSATDPAPEAQLYRQEADGTFIDVAEQMGVLNERFAKGVAWGDWDNDGDPDLYVSNLGPNRFYRNDGARFVDMAPELGVTEPSSRSFATWFFDYDQDGWLDLFVADYSASIDEVAAYELGYDIRTGGPRLYRNLNGAGFADVSQQVGLSAPTLAMGANFGDFDNDGWFDFYLGTGTPDFESISINRAYRNRAGESFEDISVSGGFSHLQKGHGVAFADIDGDGDQDLIQQLGGAYPGDAFPSALFENPGSEKSWIRLSLVGKRAHRNAIGARVTLFPSGNARARYVQVGSGGSFGGSPFAQHVGLGAASGAIDVEVVWPGSDRVQRWEGLDNRAHYRLTEGVSRAERM